MITTGKQFITGYSTAFKAAGGDPDACEAFIWARDTVAKSSKMTFPALIEAYAKKLDGGTANHGWGIGVLSALWEQIQEKDRARLLEVLKGCGLKFLLSASFSKMKLTSEEKTLAADTFRANRCEAAARRING
jgi:hypothetical protein